MIQKKNKKTNKIKISIYYQYRSKLIVKIYINKTIIWLKN